MEQAVELAQVLAARERRVWRQNALLEQYRQPLLSFTMNIAGPVKNSPEIRRGFHLGESLLLGQLEREGARLLHAEQIDEITGCEGLYVVALSPARLKAIALDIEEGTELGRLFDMDVLTPAGEKLERGQPRRCLICGGEAKACARSRAHGVAQLQEKTALLLRAGIDRDDRQTAASLTVRALLYELATTPKPGLVDRENSGSHTDMDFFTFLRSSAALWPYFDACVTIGRESAAQPAPETFARLRRPGKLAEADMLRATGGVNTHKGAIFCLGLACGALGRLDRALWRQPERILAEIAAMTEGAVAREMASAGEDAAKTAGLRLYQRHGITGARGMAEAGYPAVLQHGLPILEAGLAQGLPLEQAGACAMLHLLAHTDDTNMISRGGLARQQETTRQLRALLGETPFPAPETIRALDRAYIADHLSPGGSADLLALCYLLHFLKEAE